MNHSEQEQKLLSEIDITRANLYVFKDSGEKQQWADLLDKAEKQVVEGENYIYAQHLIDRVKAVIDNLWKRIFKWQETQRKTTTIFMIAIPAEILAIVAYLHFFDIVKNGLYTAMLFGVLGGSLGVALNIGKDLQIDGSNQLQMLRLMLRPFIGVISAIVIYALLQTKILTVSVGVDQGSLIIVLSVFAGFSERFIVKALSDYIPSVIGKTYKKEIQH
jgi:hypothetical protein